MDLNQQMETSFVAACNAYRTGGFTDIHLAGDGSSHLRHSDGISQINPPSQASIAHLAEVIAGREQAGKLTQDGGRFNSIWNGMHISIVKLADDQPFHIVVRLR